LVVVLTFIWKSVERPALPVDLRRVLGWDLHVGTWTVEVEQALLEPVLLSCLQGLILSLHALVTLLVLFEPESVRDPSIHYACVCNCTSDEGESVFIGVELGQVILVLLAFLSRTNVLYFRLVGYVDPNLSFLLHTFALEVLVLRVVFDRGVRRHVVLDEALGASSGGGVLALNQSVAVALTDVPEGLQHVGVVFVDLAHGEVPDHGAGGGNGVVESEVGLEVGLEFV